MSEFAGDHYRSIGRNHAVNFTETAHSFECAGQTLIGVVCAPSDPAPRGVVIVVGGPQYRAGSHRQFVLLARHLAAHGVAVLRFDYRGMGDSQGESRSFEDIDADIRAAVDTLFTRVAALREVVLVGLCDAASAALLYSHGDARVSGLVLLNPWVRTVEGEARTYLKHYYAGRLADPQLWRKLHRGEFDFRAAASSLFSNVRRTSRTYRSRKESMTLGETSLPERMRRAMERFEGRVLLILSGDDLTAKEFEDEVSGNQQWSKLICPPRVTRHKLIRANHTFARREWRDEVAECARQWLCSW
jgi:uncharacterized protein